MFTTHLFGLMAMMAKMGNYDEWQKGKYHPKDDPNLPGVFKLEIGEMTEQTAEEIKKIIFQNETD